MTVCQIVRGGLVGRNLAFCVFSWSNSSSISSLWLNLATGGGSERVLTMCWSSFLKSPSSTHILFDPLCKGFLASKSAYVHLVALQLFFKDLSQSIHQVSHLRRNSRLLGDLKKSSRNKPISFSVRLLTKTYWKYLGCGTLKGS